MKIFGVFTILVVNFVSINGQTSSGSILDQLQNNENNAKIFGSWCNEVGQGFYGGNTKMTVFAFDDTAYNTMPSSDRSALQSMTYLEKREYVETFTIPNSEITSFADGTVLTSMNNRKLHIVMRNLFYAQPSLTSSGSLGVYVNGALIIRQSIRASNGYIHILDRPLRRISTKTAYDYLTDPEDSSVPTTTLKDVMNRLYAEYYTEAIAPLAITDQVTFFMPSERALKTIPNSKLNSLSPRQLSNYFQMHIIPNRVVFTSYVQRSDNYETAMQGSRAFFLRQGQGEKVMVKSGGVVAEVIKGNITVQNGVIHIVDTMLGFIYNSFREQIAQDAPIFNRMLDQIDPRLLAELTQAGLNVFVPLDEAFSYIQNLPWIDINSNLTLITQIVQLCTIRDGSIEVSMLNGNYDVRQRRMTRYNNWQLTVYIDRNDTWVNSGHVRGRIVRPDVSVTNNGQLQYIDAVPGVPSMDIPTVIYYDDWLVYTHNDMKMLGLDTYLKDPRYDPSIMPPRSFNGNGDPSNSYGVGNNFVFTQNPYGNQFGNQYTTQNPYGNQQYPNNQDPNNQYPNNQNQYPNNQNNWNQNQNQNNWNQNQNQNNWNQNNQFGNQYPNNNQFGNQYPNTGNQFQQKQISPFGSCGSFNEPCQFTFFVPNGSAIYNFHWQNRGNALVQDAPRYRFIMRRLIIPNTLIFLEQMVPQPQSYQYRAHNGEIVTLKKETDNIARLYWGGQSALVQCCTTGRGSYKWRVARLYWGGQSARVILWDVGATNGVVHIIDSVLSDYSDLNRDISRASGLLSQSFGSMLTVACLLAIYFVRR